MWSGTERNVTSSASRWWMTEEQKSCCHANTPSNGICMRQIKYTHLTYAQKKKKKKEKKIAFGKFHFCLRICFSHHSKTLWWTEKAKDRWPQQQSPHGTSIGHWLDVRLKRQWEVYKRLHQFFAFFIIFSEFTYYLCWINHIDEKTRIKPEPGVQ